MTVNEDDFAGEIPRKTWKFEVYTNVCFFQTLCQFSLNSLRGEANLIRRKS